MKLTYNTYTNWVKTSQAWFAINNIPKRFKNLEYNILINGKRYEVLYKNVLWWEIGKEFKKLFGNEIKVYKHIDLETFNEIDNFDRDNYRAVAYIHTSIYSCVEDIKITFDISGMRFTDESNRYCPQTRGYFSFTPPKNMELTEANIIQCVKDYINKHILYPKGFFRDIQIYNQCDKWTAKKMYKAWTELQRDELKEYSDDFMCDMRKYFEKKYKVNGDEVSFESLLNWCRVHGKQDSPIRLAFFDWGSVFNACDNCDGDIDELETTYWDAISEIERENVVYIN